MDNFFYGWSSDSFGSDNRLDWQQANATATPWVWQSDFVRPDPKPRRIEIEEEHCAYVFDTLRNLYIEQCISSKGKVRSRPMTNGFSIDLLEEFAYQFGGLSFVRITYRVNGEIFKPIIPADDYLAQRFDRYLTHIIRLPGCTRRQLNDLIAWLLKSVSRWEIKMFSRQGWNDGEDGNCVFVTWSPRYDIPEDRVPRSVLKRSTIPLADSPVDVIARWKRIYTGDPVLQFIGYWRLAAVLLCELERAGVKNRRVLFVSPSKDLDAEKLAIMFETDDPDRFPAPALDAKNIREELQDTWDGVAVFVDRLFPDEEDKRTSAVKSLLRAQQGEFAEKGRNLVAVVSDSAAMTARRLAPQFVFEVETDGVRCEATRDEIREATAAMEALFRFAIPYLAPEPFKDFVAHIRSTFLEDMPEEDAGIILQLFCVERVFRAAFQVTVLDDATMKALVQMLLAGRELDPLQMILQDYSAAASEAFREGTLHAVRKRKNVPLPLTDSTVLISGNRMWLSDRALDLIVARMSTVKSSSSLIRALRESGNLVSTDGDTHPIEVHDAEGKRVRLFWYDLPVELLDADVIHALANLETLDFWLTPEEAPAGFIPILSDGSGKVAGFLIAPKRLDNHSVFASGQSGWGKTCTLAQLAAAYHAAGYRVIVLDGSSSATEDALSRNLSPAYVRSNVQFFDLDCEGVPVDLFRMDRKSSQTRQKKCLLGLLSAAVGDLSTTQSDVLQSAITELLQSLDEHESIQVADLMAMLNGSGLTFSSLRTRLQPLLEDILQIGMSGDSWEDMLGHSGRFLVFQTDSAFTENGNVLLDVILASLFDFQMEHSDIPLAVIIDEVQTQNVSANSPIRKVVSEGRKFRMSLIAASQDFPARSTDLGHVVGKIPTQIFLRPTLNAETTVAAELHYSKAETLMFDNMERGDAIAKGCFYNKLTGTNTPAVLRGHVHRHCSPDEDRTAQGLPDRNGEEGARDEADNAE